MVVSNHHLLMKMVTCPNNMVYLILRPIFTKWHLNAYVPESIHQSLAARPCQGYGPRGKLHPARYLSRKPKAGEDSEMIRFHGDLVVGVRKSGDNMIT